MSKYYFLGWLLFLITVALYLMGTQMPNWIGIDADYSLNVITHISYGFAGSFIVWMLNLFITGTSKYFNKHENS
jgi:cytochrome b561